MRYGDEDEQSQNVERAPRGGMGFPFPFPGRGGGRGMQIPVGRGGMSFTTLLIIGALLLLFGINPLDLLRGGGGFEMPELPQSRPMEPGPGRQTAPAPRGGSPFERPAAGTEKAALETFVGQVLRDTEVVWERVFQSMGRQYVEPKLVLFEQGVHTRCGVGMSAMGPFYCPLDQKVYVDLSFYDELKRRFKAPGDFAQAYVIAHEIGHHVQTLLGISEKVMQLKQRLSEADANRLQVRMELQADCFAGVWANLTNKIKNRLEPGDIEEGLAAASAIGDDTLQRRQQGYVVPESFTHGSSAQRVKWFQRGFESGQLQSCDTFNASSL